MAIAVNSQSAVLEQEAAFAAQQATRSLLYEVSVSPKPGLVDQRNNGAHRDMDRSMFYRSADALYSYFEKAVTLGLSSDNCMPALQQAGFAVEKTEFYCPGLTGPFYYVTVKNSSGKILASVVTGGE